MRREKAATVSKNEYHKETNLIAIWLRNMQKLNIISFANFLRIETQLCCQSKMLLSMTFLNTTTVWTEIVIKIHSQLICVRIRWIIVV